MISLLNRAALLLCLMVSIAWAQSGSEAIIGTWTQEGRNIEWTFRADGSGFMVQGQPRTTARFTWELRGDKLKVSTSGISAPYTVMSVDAGSLVIRNDRAAQVYTLHKSAS